jgi:hypothetical protein
MPSRIKRNDYIRFMKSWTEEYTIKNGEFLDFSYFKGYDNLKTINIQYYFSIDDDKYTRFGPITPKLERFVVLDKQSPFFTEDGVLYLNLDKANEIGKEQNATNYFSYNCGLPDSFSGNMLVSVPTKYKNTTFVVPDFVNVIGCCAFCGTNIEKLVIPESVKVIGVGLAGVNDEMPHLKEIRVPNHPISILPDFNCFGRKIDIGCSEQNVELQADLKSFWYNLLVKNTYHEKEIKAYREFKKRMGK